MARELCSAPQVKLRGGPQKNTHVELANVTFEYVEVAHNRAVGRIS